MSCGFMPRPTDREPCGSKSTRSTRRPYSASAAPRLIVVVVLPTPPFWLHMATTRAGPWEDKAVGSGITGIGRPVGPSAPPGASKGSVSDNAFSLPGNKSTDRLGVGPRARVWPARIGPQPGVRKPPAAGGRLCTRPRSAPQGTGRLWIDLWSRARLRRSAAEQVLVVRVVVDPALDERAQRHDVLIALRPYVVQGPAHERGSHALALEPVVDLGVGEHDRVLARLVDGDTGQLTVEPRLVAVL